MAAPSRRQELVETALRLFMSQGFHATGIAAVLAEAGLSKMSLYHHFRTKDDLILAALELRDQRFRDWLFARMAELSPDPKGQLLAVFDALSEWFENKAPIGPFLGCAFVKAAGEFTEAEDPVHRQAALHKQKIVERLAELAAQAGLAQPEATARQLALLKEGAITEAYVRGSRQAAQDAKAIAGKLL